MRIVSLLPCATEIICQLGLRQQLVGVTHECDYPASVVGLPTVTNTSIPHEASSQQIDALVRERSKTQKALYTLDMSMLKSLEPDLIVTQALCDVCAVAEAEVKQAACSLPSRPRVINLEPSCLEDVLQCMQIVGDAAGCHDIALHEIDRLRSRIHAIENRSKNVSERPTVLLLEWIDPPFCAGHWSPELVHLAGGYEVIGKRTERSRTISWDAIIEANPDIEANPEILVIACCGFGVDRALQDLPILQSKPGWESLRCVRSGRVFVVDGSAYFSRPGPRLVDSLEILAHALHPSLHPLPANLTPAFSPS